MLKSAPDLRYIRAPDGVKDISEAHIQGFDIPTWLEELKAKAETGQALKARYDNERLAQLYNEAQAVIEAEDPLELVRDAIRGQGYGGDLKPLKVISPGWGKNTLTWCPQHRNAVMPTCPAI